MNLIKFYCVTDKKINFIHHKNFNFGWVGKAEAPDHYINCNYKQNIFYKEKNYSELTFHYWYWKNLIINQNNREWIGFCQKRRYWIKENIPTDLKINQNNVNEYLLTHIEDSPKFESIICKPIRVNDVKKIKLLKRGLKNLLKRPSIFFDKRLQNIELHFDMHHGYGNLKKAIELIDYNDRSDFLDYVNDNTKFNPNIMFISKKKIINDWFKVQFEWLKRCEKKFGFKDLKGYDQTRIYAFLAERFLSFWFKKYTIFKEQPWVFIDV